MYDYKGTHELKEFYSIGEVCSLLELNRNKLRFRCLKNHLFPTFDEYYALGFNKEQFQELNNDLYYEQCRKGVDEGDPWK